MEDTKKYKPMENVLIHINSTVIALSTFQKKRNNVILQQVAIRLIDLMKNRSPLFDGMYERNFYGGSYYDQLKVGEADEYDLDLILNLPVLTSARVQCSNLPGFVHVIVQESSKLPKFDKLDNSLLTADRYLSTKKVSSWFEGLMNSALNGLPKDGRATYVDVDLDKDKSDDRIRIYVTLSKGGPAFTINLSGKYIDETDIKLDIDLVPCFQFDDKNWPSKNHGYRANTSKTKKKFLVVPKTPTGNGIKEQDVEKYWRLSFQEQERELINQDLKTLKPAVRLLKKLRDKHNHKIASYFIKTIFLWTIIDEEKDKHFWTQSLSVVFMYMLEKYEKRLREMNIPYFWNSKFNLIDNLKDVTKLDVANTLRNLMDDIKRNLCEPLVNPFTVGKYLLSSTEFDNLKRDVSLGKKFEKAQSAASTSNILNSPSVDIVDSKSNQSPPLITVLKFEPSFVNTVRQYSDSFEEKTRREAENIQAQMDNRSNGMSRNNDVMSFLKKIDEKMDMMLERFDKSEENTKEMNAKLANLEDQVKQLQIENNTIKSQINGSESNHADSISPIGDILSIPQIDNTPSLPN